MHKVVVTGGAGFIGSNLALRLRSEGYEVKIFDSLSRGVSHLLKKTDIDLVEADMLDLDRLQETFEGVDYVFHNAAIRSIHLSNEEPVRTSKTNIVGTMNVLEAARQNGVKRVVLASSSSVYGRNPFPFKEDMQPEPLSFYTSAKIADEHNAKLYHELYGLETICLRYFTVFGQGQDGTYQYSIVIPKFIHDMLRGERPVIFGDGEQSRDFTYIGNVIDANILAMKAGKNALGRAFNVGQGNRITLNEVVKKINSILDTDIEPIYKDARKGEVLHTQADLTASADILGYMPRYSFDEGLRRTVEWNKSYLKK